MGEIRWKKRDVSRIFTHAELFSTLAIYEEFKEIGDDYLDNLSPNELKRLFVIEVDGDKIPSQAMNPLHRLFDKAVEDFTSWLKDPEEFKRRISEGTKDPIRKLSEEEMFTNALKFVLVYRIATEKKTTLAVAKIERERILNLVRDVCKDMLMGIVVSSAEQLIGAAEKYDLDAAAVSRLSIRIEDIFTEGISSRLCLDGKPLDFDDDLGNLLKKDQKITKEDSFNPMFG